MLLDDLDLWFASRPKWLHEAARRLIENDEITNKDIIKLANLCYKESMRGLDSTDYNSPSFSFCTTTSHSIRLCSIKDVEGINALAPRKPLDFGVGNLTVIYGANGSGKSGYVRILKHTCGAKKPGQLLPNIFTAEDVIQKCTLEYELDGVQIPLTWISSEGVVDDLRIVDIYDFSCGQAYITNENEMKYEPEVLSFFTGLIKVCDRVSKVIDNTINKKISAKPVIPAIYSTTSSGQWYSGLSENITLEEIDKYCFWGDADEEQLNLLLKRQAEKTPGDRAKQLRLFKNHIKFLVREGLNFHRKLSDTECNRLIDLHKDSVIKRRLADLAARSLFESTPLDGVGSDTWKRLWEIARTYSEEHAYEGLMFPFVGDNARCVLCQEPLSEEAKERFQSFEKFIKGKTEADAIKAEKQFNNEIEKIGDVLSDVDIKTRAEASGLTQEDDINAIIEIFHAYQTRKDNLSQVNSVNELPKLPECAGLFKKAKQAMIDLETNAKAYDRDARTDNRNQLNSLILEMQARKWLAQQKVAVTDEIKRLKSIANLKNAKKFAYTKVLSEKKGELSEQLITLAFVRRFNQELSDLDAKHLKIELVKTRTDKGKVLHELRLKSLIKRSPAEILSEGEMRVVSLALFLADVSEKTHAAPFIFDDPISSLDQDYEDAVVQRLVKLSSKRQVIVFTHRLTLLGLIMDFGKKADIKPNIICVRCEPWGTGEPGETPFSAKTPKGALNTLLNIKLPQAKKLLEEHGSELYHSSAKAICSDFRILLERLIEHVLLAEVIKRHSRNIHTHNIVKLAKIDVSDCNLIDSMMTKYSSFEHSQSEEAPVSLPPPENIEKDLVTIINWQEEFSKRKIPN